MITITLSSLLKRFDSKFYVVGNLFLKKFNFFWTYFITNKCVLIIRQYKKIFWKILEIDKNENKITANFNKTPNSQK